MIIRLLLGAIRWYRVQSGYTGVAYRSIETQGLKPGYTYKVRTVAVKERKKRHSSDQAEQSVILVKTRS